MLTRFLFLNLFLFFFSFELRALCVSNEFANLRSSASVSSEKTWVVYRYMPLQKVNKKQGWYEVKDLDSKTHWIREDLVTSAFKCAVIKNEFAYLRTGPGTRFAKTKAEKGLKYLSFRVVKEQGDWVQVEDQQGDLAWIHRPLVWVQ